ncbi:MAG TPA: EVE domain-containing protein [Longimicrobiales bacterium]|nr:EVE domain-containing protein [Longimicrobiales bacterium]
MTERQYWLVKSEPESYSIDHLRKDGRTAWTGVRNYQARNLMRDRMRRGDPVLFYHSSTEPPGVVGLARVASAAYPDPTALDPKSDYYDEKATAEDPRWFLVDIEFVERFPRMVTLAEIREDAALAEMPLVNRSRLSVQPVERAEFERIRRMANSA